MWLVKVPAADRPYFRGMGYLFGGRGLGQDDTSIYDLGAQTNASDLSTPSSYSIPTSLPPNIVGTDLSPADLSSLIPSPTQPANTILTAAGVAVPKPGYTVSPTTGQVVPSSSLAGITSAIASIPSSYWLVGAVGIVAVAALGGGKKRRR